jgi:hypothetical protein
LQGQGKTIAEVDKQLGVTEHIRYDNRPEMGARSAARLAVTHGKTAHIEQGGPCEKGYSDSKRAPAREWWRQEGRTE